jgi:hypothetical protein
MENSNGILKLKKLKDEYVKLTFFKICVLFFSKMMKDQTLCLNWVNWKHLISSI